MGKTPVRKIVSMNSRYKQKLENIFKNAWIVEMYLEKENRNDIMAYKQTFLSDDLE